ncbi:hypothetical protein GYMLUDRAFT_56685 [Collybiopsis luxurians FD-317 M1]|nr:hypothetical protein GYMLUDRAFT_56685 [Collybiopsis luxurians FD-317 M1]
MTTLKLRLFSFFWTRSVSFCRYWVLAKLQHGITQGSIIVQDADIGSVTLGNTQQKSASSASLIVHDNTFWIRIFLAYDIGFSEAWMAGEIETPDLHQLLNLYIDNRDNLGGLSSLFFYASWLSHKLQTYFLYHSPSKSVENADGYNLSNEFYKAFLSTEMKYSCPLWDDAESGVNGDTLGFRAPKDLETAQAWMIAYILTQANVKAGDWLLEIGSGRGALAIAAARIGCTVDTITVSTEQYVGTRESIRLAGVDDRVKVHLLDYRCLPPNFEKAFDACAVGQKNMSKFMSMIDWALKDSKA